ncbi:MAG: histidine phosphatase family protein [Thermodesulfobacteriota bacterium]|nr:histidine phosphatase family protein [Thermodesulfobacteriota bacterium]MEE2975818.1 histidine phosphatase family protein [Thermodesulfobacteriota bacterium]|tara:strand:+ start:438 stop:1043 length:606 start_codon:yes stop_codon:yes gene_type:complete
MEIILVRHCETDWNKENRCQGISDLSLNQAGLKQAENLRSYFNNLDIDLIFSSTLKRAIETANVINSDKKIPIELIDELREMDQGDFEGIPFHTLREKYPVELNEWRKNPEKFRIPNGETLGEVKNRMIKFMKNIVETHREDKTIIIVSHNLALSSLLCSISEKNLVNFTEFTVESGSISTIDYSNKIFSLKTMDYTKHLE